MKTKILKGDEGRKLDKGNNPHWPGEGLRTPGEKVKDKGGVSRNGKGSGTETTVIPIIR